MLISLVEARNMSIKYRGKTCTYFFELSWDLQKLLYFSKSTKNAEH